MDLTMCTRTDGPSRVVAVAGEFDVHAAPELRRYFAELISDGARHLVIDLDGVRFLDSTGLGILVGVLQQIGNADGSLALACARPNVLEILRVTGLATVFTIHASVEAALAAGTRASAAVRT